MKFEGGCYCGKIRYVAEGEPRLKAQCHCRECQYLSGGGPNMFVLVPPQGVRYTRGEPRKVRRIHSVIDQAVAIFKTGATVDRR